MKTMKKRGKKLSTRVNHILTRTKILAIGRDIGVDRNRVAAKSSVETNTVSSMSNDLWTLSSGFFFFLYPPSHPPHSLSLLLFFLLISFSSYRFNSAYARDNLYTPLDSYFDANRFPLLRVSRVTLTKGRGVGRNNVCTLVRRRISFRACRREIRSSNRSATMTRARRTIAWSRC